MNELQQHMNKSIDTFKQKLSGIRTSRANPDMLSTISVDYYGTMVPLQQVASISVPENRTFLLNIFDKNAIKSVEKAILSSDLGLNPIIDENLIRIQLPDLTEDRRKELVKHTKKLAEETKVAIRNIRRDAIDKIKTSEKNKELTEDESKRQQDQAQTITDTNTQKIDQLFNDKEKEILTL